jgi:alkanesulfonate monooxygenase SsuD/methylene tetrahydromethanopterin reductase-like flavin-dependent oxidoreductase (luciferase family)
LPVQDGGPPIIMGGSTPKTARRAAEIADGYDPSAPALVADYLTACAELGKDPGEHLNRVGPFFMHVAEDVERTQHQLAPYVQHEIQQYAQWTPGTEHLPGTAEQSLESVWTVGSHQVLTPDQAIELARGFAPGSLLTLHPLCGGLPPELALESLQLFVEKVLPALSFDREPEGTAR